MAENGLYIQMFSVHGLVRGESPELGRDADTGGQVKYVLELARALGEEPVVERVDLVTRLLEDKALSASYGQPLEPLSAKSQIVRIRAGGRRYIRKELLWPHLDEMVDKTVKFLKGQGRIPDIFHGHYADGGYVARELAAFFGAPFIFTGHSMGAHKKGKLMGEGFSSEEINRRYHMEHRIGVEERIIREADRIIASTRHEIERQYGLYRSAGTGHYTVIPPGIDLETFYPHYHPHLHPETISEPARQARVVLLAELQRFWTVPRKPFILALCRPDQRKNIAGLVTAYGLDKELQAMANLAIFAGIRKDIQQMEENERGVLTEMLLLMDSFDLYGKLAIPKKHDFSVEVPELYRLCADSRGVFVNPALVEPFGLTLIEAAACGLPIVATRDGGPADIVANCENGILVDPLSNQEIAAACRKILVERELWDRFSHNGINGVRSHYSWQSHCRDTVDLYGSALAASPPATVRAGGRKAGAAVGKRLSSLEYLLITDIDNTLVGEREPMAELLELLDRHRNRLGWGVATGRCLDKTMAVLSEHGINPPDILICSVGTEIFYGPEPVADSGWQGHLAHRWRPEAIREAMAGLDFLIPQESDKNRPFKVSYYLKDDGELLAAVHRRLQQKSLKYHLIYSHGRFLDILPYRASKGKAIRYLSYKWGVPLNRIMAAGDSGNDESMLRGDICGLVVDNYSPELERLKGLSRIHFSARPCAAGIMDGLRHYRFIGE